jgi:hypothetical protein
LVCNDIRRQIYNLGFDHRRQALVQRREPDERSLVHFDVRYFVRIYPRFDNELVVAVANRNIDASVIFTCRLSD